MQTLKPFDYWNDLDTTPRPINAYNCDRAAEDAAQLIEKEDETHRPDEHFITIRDAEGYEHEYVVEAKREFSAYYQQSGRSL